MPPFPPLKPVARFTPPSPPGISCGGEGAVYVSNVRPGISTTDQREEGFKLEMAERFPGITVLDTQYNEKRAVLLLHNLCLQGEWNSKDEDEDPGDRSHDQRSDLTAPPSTVSPTPVM